MSKEESDLLISTYGDESCYQYALSLVEYAKGTGPIFVQYVDQVLNSITNNEHQKYLEKKANIISTANNSDSESNNNERKQTSDNNIINSTEITVDKPLNI